MALIYFLFIYRGRISQGAKEPGAKKPDTFRLIDFGKNVENI